MVTLTARLGESGITLGHPPVVDAYGVRWRFSDNNVLGPKPGVREDTADRANADGQADASRFYNARNRTLTGSARATGANAPELLYAAEQRLRDAVGVDTFGLYLTQPGFAGVQWVRQSGEPDWNWQTNERGLAFATFSIGLYADDPLTYALTDVVSPATAFPSSSGGLTVPFTVPFTINAQTLSGRMTLTNPYQRRRPLRLHLTGPVQAATIANPATGEALQLANPAGPLLGTGEYLDIDTGRRQVYLQGTADRRGWVYGDWLTVGQGDTVLALSGTAGTDARLTASFTPAQL